MSMSNGLTLRAYDAPSEAITAILASWSMLMGRVRDEGRVPDGYDITWAVTMSKKTLGVSTDSNIGPLTRWVGEGSAMLTYTASKATGRDGVAIPLTEVSGIYFCHSGLMTWTPNNRGFFVIDLESANSFDIEQLSHAIMTGMYADVGWPDEEPIFRVNTAIALPGDKA
jgi:hypothetical protein